MNRGIPSKREKDYRVCRRWADRREAARRLYEKVGFRARDVGVYATSAPDRILTSNDRASTMLYVFGGLPGTGKSTLSLQLARDTDALHLRIDTIEKALRDSGVALRGPEGYVVAYGIAADNLRLGRNVIADCVNPLRITREAWRDVAQRCDVAVIEIEVVCSDPAEHERRVASRPADDRLCWTEVLRREYQPWDRLHIVLDTAGQTVTESYFALKRLLNLSS